MAQIEKHGVASVHHGVGVTQMVDVLPTRIVLVNAAMRTKNLSVLSVQEGLQISYLEPLPLKFGNNFRQKISRKGSNDSLF